MRRIRRAATLALALLAGGVDAAWAQGTAPDAEATTVAPLGRGFGPAAALEQLRRALHQPGSSVPQVRIDQRFVLGSQTLTLTVSGVEYPVLSVPTARLEALAAATAQRIDADSRDAPSVLQELRAPFATYRTPALKGLGRFSGGFAASFAPVPTTASGPLKVNESFALALERARTLGVKFNLDQLQRLPATNLVTAVAGRRPALRPFALSYDRTIGALGQAIAAPGAPTTEGLRRSAQETTEAFVTSWPQLRHDPEARRLAVRALDGLARQSELKASYGANSVFLPSGYQGIYGQSRRTAAITTAGGSGICSGVALDAEWVMTAGHCFQGQGQTWQTLRVVIPNRDGSRGPALPLKQLWPDPAPGSRGGDAIDYAFVRVSPVPALLPPPEPGPGEAAPNPPVPPAPAEPCLAAEPAGFQVPVLVIGYSQATQLVYDHAYVLFPFRPYASEFARVEAMTGARLQRLAEAFYPSSSAQQDSFLEANLASFDHAYATRLGAGSTLRREYRGRAIDVLADRPMLGFDTDTVSGNSGGPVYARGEQVCIVGVFSGGRADNLEISEGTWKEHEFATPISAVVQDVLARDVAGLAAEDRAGVERLRAVITRLQR